MIVALAVAAVILISSGTGRQDVAGGQSPQEPGAQDPVTQESVTQEPSPRGTDNPESTADEEAAPEDAGEQASGTSNGGEEADPGGELKSPALGEPDAPVVLVEYSDYQ